TSIMNPVPVPSPAPPTPAEAPPPVSAPPDPAPPTSAPSLPTRSAPIPSPRAPPPSAPSVPAPSAAPAPNERRLAAELVPFVSEFERTKIRDLYMSAHDYKALALSATAMRFVTDQQSQKIADDAAVQACDQLANARRAAVNRAPVGGCELYASGNVVVTSRG